MTRDAHQALGNGLQLGRQFFVAFEFAPRREKAGAQENHGDIKGPGFRLGHQGNIQGLGERAIPESSEPDGVGTLGLGKLDGLDDVFRGTRDGGKDGYGAGAERGILGQHQLFADGCADRQGGAGPDEVLVGQHRGVGSAGANEEQVGQIPLLDGVDHRFDLPLQCQCAAGLREEFLFFEAKHGWSFRMTTWSC